jgi:hypothetical protein
LSLVAFPHVAQALVPSNGWSGFVMVNNFQAIDRPDVSGFIVDDSITRLRGAGDQTIEGSFPMAYRQRE